MKLANKHSRAFAAVGAILALALVLVPSVPARADELGNLASRLVAMATGTETYGVESTTRVRVSFVANEATASTQIVRSGDVLVAPPAPTAPAGEVFDHWLIGTTDITPYLGHALSSADIQGLVTASGASEDAQRLVATTAEASFAEAHTVRFHQYTHAECVEDGSLAQTFAFSMLTDAARSISLDSPSRSFTPVVEGTKAELVGWEAYGSGDEPVAVYSADATITDVSSDLELYPRLSTGFWAALETGDDVANLESLFVQDTNHGSGTLSFDRLPTEQSLAGESYNPETGTYAEGYRGWNLGWTLEGWYRTRTGSAEEGYAFADKVTEDMLLSGNVTLYAKWVPRDDTPFTIINMVEGPEGGPGEGVYTQFSAFTATGTTNGVIPASAYDSQAIKGSTVARGDYYVFPVDFGYHLPDETELGDGYANNSAQVTIAGAGNTIKYVYWNRNRTKAYFRPQSMSVAQPVSYFGMDAKYGDYIKTGEEPSVWDPNGTLREYNGNEYDNLWAGGFNGTTCYQGYYPFAVPGTSDKQTIYFGYYARNLRRTFTMSFYVDALEGQEVETEQVTINGVTHDFYKYDSYLCYTSLNNGRGYGIYAGISFDGGASVAAYRAASGVVPTTTAYADILPVMYTDETGMRFDVFYLRNDFTVSFGNVSGVIGDYDLENATLKYGSPLATIDPGFDVSTRRVVGNRAYRFNGWYTNAFFAEHPESESAAEYRVDFESDTMPSGNTVFYASWIPEEYPVTFDSVGGQMDSAEGATLSDDKSTLTYDAVESGSTLAKPETPTKTVGGVDYTFTGWYKDADYATPWDFATSQVQGPTTLYAKWVKGRVYGVTYHREDGTEIEGVDTNTYRYGARATVAPEQGSGSDKPFLGWSLVRGNAAYVVGQSFTVSSNTDLFAVYGDAMPGAAAGDVEAGAPVLTLDSNYPEGTSGHVTQEFQAARANDTVTLPQSLAGASARGWHVASWTTERGGGEEFAPGATVAVAADTTLYARWEANQLSAALDASLTYDGTAHQPAPTVTGWDGSALALGDDYELSWARNVHAHAAEGDGAPTVTVTGAGDYHLSEPISLTFAIALRPVTVTADNKASKVGEGLARLTASVTSGTVASGDDLELSPYTANAAGEPAEVDTAHAGTYSILVSHAGGADYAVTVVPGTYRVTSASLVVSAQGWAGTYDGQPHAASVALSPAAAAADGATVWWSTAGPLDGASYASGTTDAPSRTGAGTTTAWYYVQGTESYQPDDEDRAGSVDIAVAPAPLAATARPAGVTYGDPAANDGVTYSGFVAGEGASALDQTGLAFAYETRDGEAYEAGSPAGTYRIVPSGVTAENYDIAFVPGTLTVGRRPLTVAWSDADSMPYTGSARTYAGATLGNLFGTDAVATSVSGATATRAGDYEATVTGLTGARASSYALPAEGLSHAWHITTAANSATVAIDDWSYGGAPATPTAIAGFGADTATFGYADSAEGPFAPEPPTAAGTHWVRATIPATPDYEGATSPARAFSVARVPLTLTANDSTVAFGDEPADAGFTLSGFVAGDTAEAVGVGGQVAYSFGCGPGSPVGDYEIVPDVSGAWAANYDLVPAPGTLHVEKAANSWVTPPAVAGWVAGQAPGAPSAAARFGEPSFSYRPAGSGDDAWSPDPPAAAGSYEMRASVPGTGNYSALEGTAPFEVADDTLAYDAGSALAKGSTGPQSAPTGAGVEVLGCGFSWPHHDFLGWNTARDGSGEAYAPGATYVLTGDDDVLYAQWDPRGELAYDGNGATSGSVPPQPGSAGDAVAVAACGFERGGYDFAGWNTAADGSGTAYAPGDALALSLGGDVLYAQWRQRATPAQGRPMFRLYNPNSGEHFYTERAAERDAVAAAGWSYEGVGWVAPASGGDPVYRLYNACAGDHHYTLDAGERDALVAVGWRYEGVGWRSDPRRGVRVWRQYNPNALAGAHNFTTSEAEHVFLCGAGWRGEGVAWYGVR